jgi:hypothetical protein
MKTGDLTVNHNRLQILPYTNEADALCGLAVSIMGLIFVLMLEPPDLTKNPQFQTAQYRPGMISITYPFSTARIAISWADGKPLSLQFVRNVDA